MEKSKIIINDAVVKNLRFASTRIGEKSVILNGLFVYLMLTLASDETTAAINGTVVDSKQRDLSGYPVKDSTTMSFIKVWKESTP